MLKYSKAIKHQWKLKVVVYKKKKLITIHFILIKHFLKDVQTMSNN